MGDLDLRAITGRLRANADVFAALVSGVGDGQARWRPEPDTWSILEVVAHLADEEVEDFRSRVNRTLHRPGDAWDPIDPQGWATERRYNQGTLSEALDRFLKGRAESVDWLGRLGTPDWTLAHAHSSLGPIRAGDLMTSWLAHDQIHIRQINRLHREFLVESLSGYSPAYAGRW